MAVSIEDIKKLRAMTGAGLADVKKALTEAEGDFDNWQIFQFQWQVVSL